MEVDTESVIAQMLSTEDIKQEPEDYLELTDEQMWDSAAYRYDLEDYEQSHQTISFDVEPGED